MASATPTPTVTLQAEFPGNWSLADVQRHLGDIPPERIRMFPPPGFATEEDVIEIEAQEDRLYELEDGILVEKAMGWYESMVGIFVATHINNFVATHDLGKVFGADGTVKILPGMVKIPDVSFISWDRWPKEKLPRRPIPALVPDLVVEVLSESNTKKEMAHKLRRYFEAGVRLVWYIDPETQTAEVYTGVSDVTKVEESGTLQGGDVLPGFQLELRQLFAEADRQGPRDE